jgi:hypothetical protein
VAIHHPQPAVYRGSDLEGELAVAHLASLLDVARAGDQEFMIATAQAPLDAARESTPVAPILARGFEQAVRRVQARADLFEVLALYRKTKQDP